MSITLDDPSHIFPKDGKLEKTQVIVVSGAPNDNIVQNHLKIALLNVF